MATQVRSNYIFYFYFLHFFQLFFYIFMIFSMYWSNCFFFYKLRLKFFFQADHCVCSWNWKRPARFYLYRLIVTILQIPFVIMVSPLSSHSETQNLGLFPGSLENPKNLGHEHSYFFRFQAYFNLRRTLSSRINSIKRSSIFKVKQTPTRIPLIKTPGEQSIFSSMDSDMQTITTHVLSSQGILRLLTT